jgi:ABC-type phosphate/phosphonate transport system substrate-binding protein
LIASLGMYIRPETAAATDRFWGDIRDRLQDRGIDAPAALSNDDPVWDVWQSPDLAFSQTCGRPYRLKLHGKVQLVGTPDYGLQGCAPGYYRSPFVVRADDPRQALVDFKEAVFAFNEELSQSGWAAAQNHVAALGFQFRNVWQSGGHLASAKSVAEGGADIAALDGLTWELIQRYEGFASDLRVLEWTAPTPGLPYITGLGVDADGVFEAVQAAISALSAPDRANLGLQGIIRIPANDYLAVANP